MRWAHLGGHFNLYFLLRIIFFIPKRKLKGLFIILILALNEPVTTTVHKAVQSLGNIDSNYLQYDQPGKFQSRNL